MALLEFTLSDYVNAVARAWHRPPPVFNDHDPKAWPIYLTDVATTVAQCGLYPACHGTESGIPTAYVPMDPFPSGLDELNLTHELAETIADPYGGGVEIVDPVATIATIDPRGQIVESDFLYPAWLHGCGQRDWLKRLRPTC